MSGALICLLGSVPTAGEGGCGGIGASQGDIIAEVFIFHDEML